MDIIATWWLSFLAGLFTPLGSVCVIPLYPGFIAFLAAKIKPGQPPWLILLLGAIVAGGVIVSMFVFGFLFVTFLYAVLSAVLDAVSMIAFSFLAVVSIFLILDVNLRIPIPKLECKQVKNPFFAAFIFGFFFGVLVLPCNAASIVLLLALSTSAAGYVANLVNFVFFGFGMALPLILLCMFTLSRSAQVISFLSIHKREIQITAGIIMLGISLYYLNFLLAKSFFF